MVRSIAGFIDTAGVPRSVVESMLQSAFRVTNGPQMVWRSNEATPAVLGFSGPPSTKASAQERQPSSDPATGRVLVADIRLDNRKSLRAELAAPQRAGDAALALLAYRRWGLDFGRHLLGAFVIAIWDYKRDQLVLCRDQMGVRSLIYTGTGERCVFGSTVDAVLRASPASHPARVERLQNMLVGLEEIEVDTTAFDRIMRVPAATCVTWQRGSQPFVHDAYWVLQEQEQLELASDREYGEALHEVLDEAVRCRLEAVTRPAVNLSGGIDSSIIVALAAAQQSQRVRTYSAVATTPRPHSDTPYVHRMIRHFDVDPVLLSEDDLGRLHRIGTILDDPDGFFDTEQGVQAATAKAMSDRGEGVLLSGIGGDDFFDVPVSEVALRLLGEQGLRAAIGELIHFDTWPLPHGWIRPVLRQFAPDQVVEALRHFRRPPTLDQQFDLVGIGAGTPGGQRLERAWIEVCGNPLWSTRNARLNRGRRNYLTVALERYDRVGARHGIDVRHPLLDVRLIEFALSLPAEQLHHYGWTKWILRNGTVTDLPSSVAWRPKSGMGLGEFWDAVTRQWWPPDNVCRSSPDLRLFERHELPGADCSARAEFIRYIVKCWWDRNSSLLS